MIQLPAINTTFPHELFEIELERYNEIIEALNTSLNESAAIPISFSEAVSNVINTVGQTEKEQLALSYYLGQNAKQYTQRVMDIAAFRAVHHDFNNS